MAKSLVAQFEVGDLVRLRGREWTIEATPENSDVNGLRAFDLACIDDDAQGERLRIVPEAEIDLRRVEDDLWEQVGRSGTDADNPAQGVKIARRNTPRREVQRHHGPAAAGVRLRDVADRLRCAELLDGLSR